MEHIINGIIMVNRTIIVILLKKGLIEQETADAMLECIPILKNKNGKSFESKK